jgi:GntR family transcriptional regulator/MocR family aminotransferase
VVNDAYAQLTSQGFLITRPRTPPIVAQVELGAAEPAESSSAKRAPLYDLVPWIPDVSLFPLARWLTSMQRACRETGPKALAYQSARGVRSLRETLADHLGRTRGVIADPNNVFVTQGTAQALDMLLRLLRTRGATRVAVEDPSHTIQHDRIRAAGIELVPQPVDDEGIIVDGLDAAAALVLPAHHYPLGMVLSASRRRDLLAWATATDGLILEDDYDAEFRYDHEPVRAMQGLAPERVAYLGTVSKTLAPSLRIGWAVLPAALVEEAIIQKHLLDYCSPALDQLALHGFMQSGDYDRHIRRARSVYRRRRDKLVTSLAKYLPEFEIEGIAAGLSLVLRLPDGVDDEAIQLRAAEARVRIRSLSRFYIEPGSRRGLVLGYGGVHETAMPAAVRQLAACVRAEL